MAYAFGYGHGFGFGLGFLNFLGTIFFFVFLVWAVKFFLRGGRGWGSHWRSRYSSYHAPEPSGEDQALRTASERLARGEIGREEFEAIKKELRTARAGDTGGPPFERWFRGSDRALDIARMRFARGEISAEEFETIKKGLES
ncbi:MAG TPA: SHOCT domain-containing protein [Trueperaceae bacterium]